MGAVKSRLLIEYPMTVDDVLDSADRELLFAVLDAADAPAVPVKMDDPEIGGLALYMSNRNPELRLVAPYLVRADESVMGWIHDELWQDPWGILIEADVEQQLLRKHLRRFLLVEAPDGKTLYFRFYDPRVLRTFLSSSTDDELLDFFGPVQAFIARGTTPDEFTRFALRPVSERRPQRLVNSGQEGRQRVNPYRRRGGGR